MNPDASFSTRLPCRFGCVSMLARGNLRSETRPAHALDSALNPVNFVQLGEGICETQDVKKREILV